MSDTSARPTRVRYRVLGLLCLLAMITYMDRAANGSAKPAIMAELGVAEADFFQVFLAFQLAYALFEIPSGWLGDTVGPRSTLLRVVVWWTAFVALTGFVGLTTLPVGIYLGFTWLVIIQFLFGVGEAGAFPNISKALYNWFPSGDRGFAKSAVWMSARFMGGMTPALWVVLTRFAGWDWHEALWAFAAAAAVWCVLFALTFTNTPAENRTVNDAELAEINAGREVVVGQTSVPWRALLGSRNLWAICIMYIPTNFNWYFLMYFLPGALKDQFPELKASRSGELLLAVLSGAPLLVGMLGCYLGGVLSDRYIRRTGDRKWGRRLYGMIGYGLAGVFYLLAASVKVIDPDNLYVLAGLLIGVGFANDLMMAPAWAVCQDSGRRYAATVSGAMNMVGNLLGATTGILVTGLILKHVPGPDGFVACFTLYGLIYGLGVVAWLFIDASEPVAPEADDALVGGR